MILFAIVLGILLDNYKKIYYQVMTAIVKLNGAPALPANMLTAVFAPPSTN